MHQSTTDTACTEARQPASDRLRILHVVIKAGPTNSQWNEHCLPVADERDLTVCSLFPATVAPDPRIARLEGDGTVRGALRVLRRALDRDVVDVVHVHAPASAALLLLACALERRSMRNVVFTLHNSWPNLRPRNRWLAAGAMATFPMTVACSESASASIPAPVRWTVRPRVAVVPNGVDVSRIDRVAAPATAREPDPSRLGMSVVTVGRLIPIKNQASLLTAFARIASDDDMLTLVGEGPLRPRLERQALALGIADRTRFLGLLPRDRVYRLLGDADVFASPSHGEGLPLSVLEAMAAGLPLVVSDIAPHRELLAGTDGAVLVPDRGHEELTRALASLKNLGAEERRRRGEAGRQRVVERFSLPAMARGYDRVYADLTRRSGA